jgi:nitrous oxidase accessory protein NosD
MLRIVVVLLVLATGSAVGAAMFAHGSQAAPQAVNVEQPQPGPASVPGPAPLREAESTIQRTFVSTSGSDANPCTRTDPCRSFPAAIAQTTAGGEVVALDSGGYGAFSVDKAITIAGAPGAHVAVTVFGGTGITVNVGGPDTVVLRNLYVTGLGGDTGIFFQAGGRLFVESVVASGFAQRGLDATAAGGALFVRDSIFRSNNLGLVVNGTLRTEIADSRADRNGDIGFWLTNSARGSVTGSAATRNGGPGFSFGLGAIFTVSDSLADGSANGAGVEVLSNDTQVTLTRVTLSNNTVFAGLVVAIDQPVARISGSTVTGNSVGLFQISGSIETFQDNVVRGNATDTQGTLTPVTKT